MSAGPTKEIGRASSSNFTLPGWGSIGTTAADDREYAPKLRGLKSVEVFERMETDAQAAGLSLGMTLPIRRLRWFIDPNGAIDQLVEDAARDFNLPIKGQDAPPSAGRDRRRFNHDRHLAHTLRAPCVYGWYFFEQYGEIVDGKWRLRKLAPRPPFTVSKGGKILVAKDGGLDGIEQGVGLSRTKIPGDRLVAYVWEQEGANWYGRSLLRPMYRHWRIKDELLRLDVMKHARNSMGMPWFETDPDLSQDAVNALAETAERMRAGEQSGGAGPGKLSIKGTEGSLSDILASIRYQDQQMSMAMVQTFTDLGRNSETGSRSLGEVSYKHFAFIQEMIANWHATITTEHALWDWVDWNYGGDEGAPLIGWERVESEEASVSDMATLIDKGVIVPDDSLSAAIRQRFSFPPPDDPNPEPPEPVVARSRKVRRDIAASTDDLSLPDRELRRQPYSQEVAAKVDYELMDAQVQGQIDGLVAKVKALQADQIDELASSIEAAGGDLGLMASVEATPVFSSALEDAMFEMAAQGVEQAMGEATRQGITAKAPDLDTAGLTNRASAVDTLLSRSLSEAAGRKAVGLTAESGALTPADVAAAVKEHLLGLSDDYLQQQLSGATVQAMNTGRKAVFQENPPKFLYASELLDENACTECTAVDGTEYDTLEEAEADYPTGGYANCEGGPRCRGTLIGVHVDEAEPSQ